MSSLCKNRQDRNTNPDNGRSSTTYRSSADDCTAARSGWWVMRSMRWWLLLSCDSPVKVSIRPVMLSFDRRMTTIIINVELKAILHEREMVQCPSGATAMTTGASLALLLPGWLCASAMPNGHELAFIYMRYFFCDPPVKGLRWKGFGPPHVLDIFHLYCEQSAMMKTMLFRAYIVWSICADIFAICGIAYLVFW